MRDKKYIYILTNAFGQVHYICADNKNEISRYLDLDLLKSIEREKNIMIYLKQEHDAVHAVGETEGKE